MVTSRFNAADLSKLLKKPNACVFLQKSKRHIALTPKALNNTNDAVLVHLNRLVRKFDPELDAVVLGCRNVSILTDLGTIVDDSPHVHIDIEAEFYLFKPEKDSLLSGVVNKKSRDNIGCLVHDIFNVSIPIEPDEGIDIDNISIGQTLTFCVVVVDFSHPIPFIKGKLIDSRAQSPSKQASEGKKRKRSDQLEVCKKIKLEIDSPLCAEDNVNTFTPPIKFPTSILKKTTPFGVESSPARRISFFGDVPEAPDETNTTEGKAKKKKKNEASFLEESPSRRKKKPSVSSLGNEPETEVGIQDSRQIDSDSTGNQKVKKKHSEQTNQVHDFADEPEQDFNILQDFKVHSKKTKNKAAFENSSKLMEADEISKEINDLSASHLKTKKKKKKHEILEEIPGTYNASNIHEKIKKQGNRNENETWITKQNHHDQEQSNETPNRKKPKKSNKMALNEQENTSFITSKGEHSEETVQGSPQKRKKRISEEEGELKIREFNVAEIINKTVEDAMKSKKRKEQGISEVDVQQNESSVSSPKKQNPNITNEIKQRKKALSKGKKDPLQTLTSFPEHCPTEEQHPQPSILQSVQLTPVVKKKKNEKISPEHGEVSDSRVHEYFGKKDKSFSENSKIKRIINSTTIDSSNRLQENHYSGAGDNSFESLSPIKKSNDGDDDDDDDNEEEEEPSGFITSTQIEGSKTKKMVSNAASFGNDLNEVSVRNSFSDSDSFDVEEFSLSYVPQNVKQKKESKDHIASPISSQERKSQISDDGIDATNSTNVTTKRGKHSDIDNISNNMLVPRLSPFTSKQNMTVQSMNQKRHSKSSGADSSISDSESHSREQNKKLRISRIKSTEMCSPKSMISKGVQTDEESDGVKSNEHAAGKEKKMYFSDKQMKVQSRTLTSTKHERNESNDADSTDSDLPTFLKKPTKLSSVTTQSGNVPHEPMVSSNNTHKKGTRKSKITDGGPHLNPQKQDPMSPVKKNIFDKPKSKGMDKKHDPVSSSVDSNLHLSKAAKPAKQKQFPNSYQEHGSDSSSSDSDVPSPKHLPPSKAAKTKTQKEVHVSYQEQGSSSSDEDLPLSMDVPLSKAAKTTTQKQVPVSHKKQASVSSVDLNLPPSKAAKPAKQKQFPISYQEHGLDSSSSDSDVPSSKHLSPSKADKTKPQKKVPVSHQQHDSSSSDSDLPLSMDVPLSKAAKTTTQKQVPVAHKKQASVSSSVSNLSLSKATKLVTQKQIPVPYQEHGSHSSNSDSDVSSSNHLSPSKAARTKSQKKVPVSHQQHDSSSSDSDLPLPMDVPLSKAAKTTTQKQVPVSHKKQASVSSSVSNLPLSKATKLVTQKQIPVSYQEHGSHSSSSDSDVPLSINVPPSKTAKTTQKQVSVSHKKHDSDSSSSDSDLPSSKDLLPSKAAKTTTHKQLLVSHKKHGSESSSSDSDLPSSKAARITPPNKVSVSREKPDSGSSSSDSDLPLSMDLPLSKAIKMTTQKQFPVSHKKHKRESSSGSDLPLSKVAKIMKQKQSSTSNKKSGLQSSNSISNPSSHLMTKTLLVKLEPLSPHKSFSSVGKKSSGTEMTTQPNSKISTTKKKDTKASKRVTQHLGSKETKSSGSETNSIVKGLLAKMKTEILDPPLKSSKTGKMEESKKASKEKHGDNSLAHTNERKGKKTNNSKETVDSSKPRKKHEVKEKSDGFENLTDELLKNMVLRKEKKK